MKINKLIYIIILFASLSLVAQDSNLSNMYRLAKTFEESGQFEQAKNIYEDIYKAQPFNTTFLDALNNIYILLKEYDKSIELMTKNIEASPGNANYYGLLGNTYYTKGDTTKAYETWDEALIVSNNNVVAYRVIINYALQNRAFNKAIEYLKRGKELNNSQDVFALDLARVFSMTMNFDKAAVEYCEIIKNDPKKTQMVLGNMTSFLSRPNAIIQTIKSVEQFNEENDVAEINMLLIHLYKLNNDYSNAFKYVEQLETQSDANGREYFNFGQQALSEGKYSIASKAFESLIKEYPNSPLIPTSRIGFAKTSEQSLNSKRDSSLNSWKPYSKNEVVFSGEYKKVINSFRKIYELYPNNEIKAEAIFRIADIYLHKLNKPDSALLFYNQILESNKISQFSFESELRIAGLKLRQGDFESSVTRLQKLLLNPQLNENFRSKVNLLLGKVYFWKGQFKASSQKLTEVTNNLFDDNANDALQILTLISTLKSDSLTLAAYSNAEFSAYTKNFEKAAFQFEELRNSQNPIIKELSGLKYAQVLAAEDKYNSALEVLSETEENNSLKMFEPEIEFLKGEIKFFALKDYDGALTAYRNILENHSNSLYFDKSRQKIEYINEMKKKTI